MHFQNIHSELVLRVLHTYPTTAAKSLRNLCQGRFRWQDQVVHDLLHTKISKNKRTQDTKKSKDPKILKISLFVIPGSVNSGLRVFFLIIQEFKHDFHLQV